MFRTQTQSEPRPVSRAGLFPCVQTFRTKGGESDLNGLHIPAWSGRRRVEALAWVKAEGRRRSKRCVICKQSIDYSLESPHPQSCSVQHLKSRKLYPHLTWERTNWAPAHLDCNKAAGLAEEQGMGVTSEDW